MRPIEQLEVRVLPLSQLRPAPYNPRKPVQPGSPVWRKLEQSLREFGLVEPLVYNLTTGHIVGGHLRLAILKHLGVKQVPVSVVQLDPPQEKALNVVLNNREAQGSFDPHRLGELLSELADLPELELTGFGPETLAALRLEPMAPAAACAGGAGAGGGLDAPERVEVRLLMAAEVYAQVCDRLNALVGEQPIECHVRRVEH
jgi:hypothetical protein